MSARVVHHPVSTAVHPRPRRASTRRPPSISYRACILVLALLFFAMPFALTFFAITDLDVCVVERFPNHRTGNVASLGGVLNGSDTVKDFVTHVSDELAEAVTATITIDPISTNASDARSNSHSMTHASFQPTTIMLILLIACCLIKSFLPASHSHHQHYTAALPFIHALKVLLAYMWYLAAYFLCNALKGYLGDETCNTHANSISGHYLFHLYAGLALLHIHAQQTGSVKYSVLSLTFHRRLFQSNVSKFFMFFFIAYSLSSCIILSNTYLHGYHSARQILYGICMALVSHWLMMDVLDMVDELAMAHLERVTVTHTLNGNSSDLVPLVNTSTSTRRPSVTSLTSSGQMRKRTLTPSSSDPHSQTHNAMIDSLITTGHQRHYYQSFSRFQRLLYFVFAHTLTLSEERGLFFVFPFLLIFLVQIAAFAALLLSPASSMWRSADLIVLGMSWMTLGYLYWKHLRLPVLNGNSAPLAVLSKLAGADESSLA